MTPQMQEALYQISLCFDPDPDAVFRQIVHTLSACYGNTMAMINLTAGERMVYRAVANPIPLFQKRDSLALQNTF